MSSGGSWLQFGNRMNKFKGSYFQDFADICGNLIVRNGGDAYLYSQSNLYMLGGDISMNGYVYCKGVVDLSGNSLSGSGDGGGGGLTTLSVVNVKSVNTTDFLTTDGYSLIGGYLNVTGSTTIGGTLTANNTSNFNGHINASDASFNNISFANTELKGDIIPDINAAYDIGSAEKKIRDLYVSDSSIWIGDNNKLAIENDKIIMKKRKKGDSDIPTFIKTKLTFVDDENRIAHIKYFASQNGLKDSNDNLSTYTVADWIKFANRKGSLGEHGFTKTNHSASELYDLSNDFDNDDSGQWTTRETNKIGYSGAVEIGSNVNTQALDVTGRSILNGRVVIGSNTFGAYNFDVTGASRFKNTLLVDGIATLNTTNINQSLSVLQNANISGKIGVGTSASGTYHLDVNGKTRVNNDAYFKKSLLVGANVTTNSLTTNDASGASVYVETKMNAGVYPDISHNIVMDVPNTVFKANDTSVTTNRNYLEVDTTNRRIIPYVKDVNGDFINGSAADATGWDLGGPGQYRFDKVHARDLNISDSTINIEDASGNKIGMSFDATTGAVNYTVTTKDTADASGETFVIKGVQTQKISSGSGTIDPALLEFTGLSFGDTFDSAFTYDLTSTYTYNLTTTTYTGDGVSTFTDSAGAQGLNAFISATNEATLLGSLPTKESAVIRVGTDDRADGGLNGIDTPGSKVDLTNKIISVSDDDGGTTLKFTLWGSETDLNATTPGNFLNYIELKNINMASGTYFVAKTAGNIVYNNANEDNLKNSDLTGVVNGDLFLYIDRAPGNNWTKIPVSLPTSGSITTQMLADSAVATNKIATNAIDASKIVDGAIITSKIADDSITAVKFKAGEINGTIFADDAIDGAKIAGNIAASKITGTFDGSVITDNTIISSKIADGSITTAKIAYLGVSGDNLMAGSVISSKIAADAVTTDKIQDGAISSAKLASGVINSDTLIADNVITESKIFGSSVTEGKIASNAISSSKIQTGSITADKIATGAVTLDKINGSVFAGKQDTLVAGSGIAITTNSDGNPEISSTVSASVGTGDITTDLIADGAITAAKLADGISIGGGGGGGGGGGSTGIYFNKPETEIIGSANQKLGHGSQAWYYTYGSYIYGSLSNNVHMNDDGNLIVVTDTNKNTLIYAYASDTWSLKQTINIPALSGNGDTAVLSKDGTTIAIRAKVTGWQLNDYPTCGTYIYVYKDPTATWDTIPSQLAITESGHTNAFGLSHALSRDGSIMAVCTSNSTLQTATNSHNHIFVFNTDTYASDSNPIITIPLDSYPDVVTTTKIIGKIQISGDASKIFLHTKKTTNFVHNARLFELDYTNNTYSDYFDFSNTPEATRAAMYINSGSFNGFSMNNDGTRMAFGIKQLYNSSYSQLLFYHYDGSNWSLETEFTHLTLGYSDLTPTDYNNPGTIYARSEFMNDNKVAVFSSSYNSTGFPSFIFTFEYINNTWTKTNVIEMGGAGILESGFSVSSTGSYTYVQPGYDSNKGRIAISIAEELEINTQNIKTKTLLLDDGVHDFLGGTNGVLGSTYSTQATGNHIIQNGNMFISSNELNTAGTGANLLSTNKYFDKSPMLILCQNTASISANTLHRPAIEFRTTERAKLNTHDWRMYAQGYTGSNWSDLIFQSGWYDQNNYKHYRYDMVRFARSTDANNAMVLNYNTIGIEGDATRRIAAIGLMTLAPRHTTSWTASYGTVNILNGANNYPASGSAYATGIEFRNWNLSKGVSAIWCHEDTTHFDVGDMSIMTKANINFYNGVTQWSNWGEKDQSAYKTMSIGSSGVSIGADTNAGDSKLFVNGKTKIAGILDAEGFVEPLNVDEIANVVADTQNAIYPVYYDYHHGLGSSQGDRICMNNDADLIVLANVSLKTVYTFRYVNGSWEDFATVSADATKYITKDTYFFGRVIALSKDGTTLAISDRITVWIYIWNSGTSTWNEQTNTCSDAVNYPTSTNSTTQATGFCHNMKITTDGSKLLILSYNTNSDYKLRIYDTSTGNVLVNVTDNTYIPTGHTSQIDPGAVYARGAWFHNPNFKGFANFHRWKIAMSGDGSIVAISGTEIGENWENERTTLLFDIDYNAVTPATLNIIFDNSSHPNVALNGKVINGRSLAFNEDGTVFAIAIGSTRGTGYPYETGREPRVVIYRRSLSSPASWTNEKEYEKMSNLIGSGSTFKYGDGYGEQIVMNSDGSVIYIAAHTSEHPEIGNNPTQHFVGKVSYNGNNWSSQSVISGPTRSYWAMGISSNSTGDKLAVSNLHNFDVTGHGGGFHTYNVTYNDLKFISPGGVLLSGGGNQTAHLTIDADGNVGIGATPVSNVKLYVDGVITATGAINANSDDRLKINETLINDAVTTIQKLRPEIYDKKPTIDNTNSAEWVKESGLIAQEVWYSNPELRHLVTPGSVIHTSRKTKSIDYKNNTGTETEFYIINHKDPSGNYYDYNDIFVLDENGDILIDASGNVNIDIKLFLLVDSNGNNVLYDNKPVLDYDKLKNKHIEGVSYKKLVNVIKEDEDGNKIYDNSGNFIYVEIEDDVVDDNNVPFIDPSGEFKFIINPITVKKRVIDNRPKYEIVDEVEYIPVNHNDIQDYTPNDDIQNDPDYKALGWGDTPAKLNYNGLIPYLIKAIQEQQETIDVLKSEVEALKNP